MEKNLRLIVRDELGDSYCFEASACRKLRR